MPAELPREVSEMMAKREHRMHHWLWHEVRNNWHLYPRDVQSRLDDLGWRPPRPLMDEEAAPTFETTPVKTFSICIGR